MQRPDYGIDAPPVVRNLALGGAAGIVLGIAALYLLRPIQPAIAVILASWGIFGGTFALATAGLMVWSSKVGKKREVQKLLDTYRWRGDETVLHVGPGRGLLLISAAKRLTTGKALGVDIWQSEDQSDNRPENTLRNARAEGVANRIELKDGDARKLPFENGSFEVVVSSLTLHNIYNADERAKAVREIDRVLKPDGRAMILDFQHTGQYEQVLREAGWRDVQRTGPHLGMFPPVRWVTGAKPGDGSGAKG